MPPLHERPAAGALEQEDLPLFGSEASDARRVYDSSPPPSRGGGWAACCRRPAAAFWSSGVACALGSSLCFACAAAVVKTLKGINPAIPVFEIVVVRALVSGAVTSLSCRAGGLPIFGQTAPQWLLIARGVIGGSAMTLSYEALVRLPIADSTVIFYMSPAITALLCWLLLGEAFGWLTAAGCCASLTGVLLVAQPPWLLGGAAEWSHQRLLGTIFGVCGAALAAGAYACIRLIGKREHPLTVAMYFHIFAFVSSVIPLAFGYPAPAVLPSALEAALLLAIACGSFGGNLLVNRAFQLELAAKASAVNFSQVIFAYFLGTVLFHDKPTLLGLAGTGLIALGVVIVNLEKLQRSKGAAQPVPDGSAAGGPQELPQRQYQPLGHAAPAAGGGWWRRLWGRATPQQQQQQQQQELGEQLEGWAPDYRGRLKAKHSGKHLEVHLELGVVPDGEARNGGSSGGDSLSGSRSAAAGQRH